MEGVTQLRTKYFARLGRLFYRSRVFLISGCGVLLRAALKDCSRGKVLHGLAAGEDGQPTPAFFSSGFSRV